MILALGTATMLGGAVLAVFSVDLKRTLACSSMSQIGFILVGTGMLGMPGEGGGEEFRILAAHVLRSTENTASTAPPSMVAVPRARITLLQPSSRGKVAVAGGLVMLMGIFLLYHQLGTVALGDLQGAAAVCGEKKVLYVAGACISERHNLKKDKCGI